MFLFFYSKYKEEKIRNSFKWKGEKGKKILIYYNKSGGAHLSTKNTIWESFHKDYSLMALNISTIYWNRVSPLAWITGGVGNADNLYNLLLRFGFIRFMNFMAKFIVPFVVIFSRKKMIKVFRKDFFFSKAGLGCFNCSIN